MNKLHYTDKMFLFLKKHCSDNLISCGLKAVRLLPSNYNCWDITEYVVEYINNVSITDKLNLVWCFLNNGGTIIYQGSSFERNQQSFLMSALVTKGIINQQQEADILMPWIDCTHGEPFFDLKSNNNVHPNQ